jgi:hypothetical protein
MWTLVELFALWKTPLQLCVLTLPLTQSVLGDVLTHRPASRAIKTIEDRAALQTRQVGVFEELCKENQWPELVSGNMYLLVGISYFSTCC